MPSQSHSPSIAGCLLVAILFALGFLAIVSLSDSYASRSLQKHEPPPNDQPEPLLEKRLLGLGGLVGLVPSLLGNVVPGGIVSSLVAQVTADINSLLPILDNPGAQSPDGMPLVTGGQAALPLTAHPLPTNAQLGGLADKLGGLLNGIAPVAAPSIIAAITKQALGVVTSVEAIATNVASLGNQIANGQIQAPDALGQIGGLLGSLDSKVNDIINDVTSNLSSDLPLPVLQDLSQAISSGLGDIVGAANGPLSLVGDLVEQNVCGAVTRVDGVLATVAGLCGDIPSAIAQVSSEIGTSPLINSDATLTGDASASTIFPNSPTDSGGPTAISAATSSPQSPQDTSTNPTTSASGPNSSSVGNSSPSPSSPAEQSHSDASPGSSSLSLSAGSTGGVPSTPMSPSPSMAGSAQPGQQGASLTTTTGANGIVTVTEYQTRTQSCTSGEIQPTAAQTVTLTVYPPCPTSPYTAAPQATCNCPNTNPTPGGNGAKGPCPGTGYTCNDCLDGWFCPPSQTPAQPAPCGYGWPCAHCEGGWFCAPLQTPGPCTGSSAPTVTSPGTTSTPSTSFSSPSPGIPEPGQPSPPPPEKPMGWRNCGCWADLDQRALNTEVFSLDLLTNEDCIQHCIVRGFVMAGTENGNNCLCGNFLNGTQKMDESVCSIPCAGDVTQMCGGLNALSCYSPDGQPYGWASAGPQPRAPTIVPPEVLELNIGGVAHTEITTPAIVFPPGTANPEDFINNYGKTTSRPLGDLPRDLTFSSPPNAPSSSKPPSGGGGVAPGQGTMPATLSSGQTPSNTGMPGDSTHPNTTPNTSSIPNAPGNPTTPGTPGGPDMSGAPGVSSTPTIPALGGSTSPNGNGGVAPGQVNPSTSSTNGESSPSPSTGITPTGPSANPTSNNPGSGSGTMSPSNPSENPPGASGSSTPNGTGGAAPGHGQSSSTTSGSKNPISTPSEGSTVPPDTTSVGGPGTSSTPTAPGNPGHETTPPPTNMPSGSNSCVPGIDANCSPTVGVSSTPGQTKGPMTPGGENPSGSTPQPSSGGSADKPSSSTPSGAGGVAPEHGQPTTPSPSGNSIICTPGSSDFTCISSNPSEGTSPGHSSTLSASSTTCSPGSNDPACVSPFGGGSVEPGHQQPTSTPSGLPNTCTAGSTDPACTSPSGGENATPSDNQPSGPASSRSPNNPTTSVSPTRQTSPPGAPSGTDICAPGSTDPNCSAPDNGGSLSPTEAPGQGTTLTPSSITSAPTIGSTSSSQDGNTETNPGQSSTSTPGGAGGVAPGQQSPGTQPSQSNTQVSETTPNPSEGSIGITTPPGTGPNSFSPNGGTPSPGSPGGPAASNPSQGGSEGPKPGSDGPQTSYTFPPGVVPYGSPSPSMRTVASMLAWREPDGAVGAPAMLHPAILHDGPNLSQEAPTLDYEEAPTTVTSSKPADPRWQRIRPVYIW